MTIDWTRPIMIEGSPYQARYLGPMQVGLHVVAVPTIDGEMAKVFHGDGKCTNDAYIRIINAHEPKRRGEIWARERHSGSGWHDATSNRLTAELANDANSANPFAKYILYDLHQSAIAALQSEQPKPKRVRCWMARTPDGEILGIWRNRPNFVVSPYPHTFTPAGSPQTRGRVMGIKACKMLARRFCHTRLGTNYQDVLIILHCLFNVEETP